MGDVAGIAGNAMRSMRRVLKVGLLPAGRVALLAALGVLPGISLERKNEFGRSGDFRIGVSGTYLSAWKAGLSYIGFLGNPSRQPLADRNFVMLSLERTF